MVTQNGNSNMICKAIPVDFNAETQEGVRLTTRGAVEYLKANPVVVGELVLITDGEIRVHATVVERDGVLTAVPDWSTLEELCPCKGCRFLRDGWDHYGLSIDRNINVHEGHDHTIDDRSMRLGLYESTVRPEKWYPEHPEEWVCAEARRTIALEAIQRWTQCLEEAEQEIANGGPAWKK